ncbi:hypothetical protein IFM89_014281 [Coptis chinensis]|uniref:R13L1/DRL21-like LRR repeat region domain-containing protein n=1 Tax=Coptis chinensis TaxID=261450 RepID=A0A835H2V0_9MAGN|nr:hypothetical protein IFM89_014281 [Coptis chinensis]
MKRIESVLDGLQPHTNLARLRIQDYEGNVFPSWISSNTALPNIVKLELSCCNQCSELPALGTLQYLEFLTLSELGSVKRIGREFYGLGSTNGSENSVQSIIVFPKLHTLVIENMKECKEWHLPFRRGVEIFPMLRKLDVAGFMNLQMLPVGLRKLKSLEELSLFRVKFRDLKFFGIITRNSDDDNVQEEGGESAPPVVVFPVLKELRLSDMLEWEEQENEIKLPIRRDEEEGFIMPCLRELDISYCPKLKVVPHYLFSPALRSVRIANCPQLTGRQPCLPPLLEKLQLWNETGILSKSIVPLISGIGSPDHNKNAYPNLHSFSI